MIEAPHAETPRTSTAMSETRVRRLTLRFQSSGTGMTTAKKTSMAMFRVASVCPRRWTTDKVVSRDGSTHKVTEESPARHDNHDGHDEVSIRSMSRNPQ